MLLRVDLGQTTIHELGHAEAHNLHDDNCHHDGQENFSDLVQGLFRLHDFPFVGSFIIGDVISAKEKRDGKSHHRPKAVRSNPSRELHLFIICCVNPAKQKDNLS